MARPSKSVSTMSKNLTKDEIRERTEEEKRLKGKSDKIKAPEKLNENQKKIFNFIIEELEEAKLLGNLDIFILVNTSIAIDRLMTIEYKINENPALQFRKEIISSRKNYAADFYRGCNELSLSPQSRAKLSNINVKANEMKEDPLIKALEDDD